MSTANRVFVEIFPHSLQLAVVAGRRLVACGDYSLDDKEALAAFLTSNEVKQVALALVSPKQPFARLSGQEAVTVRSEEGLLACAQTLCATPPAQFSAVACDAATGKPVDPAGQEPWLMAGTTVESLATVRDQLAALGLPTPALTALALPAQLGSVVSALQDMPESARVAVLALGENDSVLGLVSATGIEVVRPLAVGFTQIYEAVQLGLGLKFRAAAPKLFFNASYDFADASEKIAAHLAVPVQAALSEFTERPGILHVVGLPEKQEWLSRALCQALGMTGWIPDAAKICSQLEMEVSAGIAPTANTLRLIQLAAANDTTQAAWLPFSLADRPKPAPAPVAPVAVKPAPAPVAPPAAAAPAPKKPVVTPPPAKAAAPVIKPAVIKPAAAPVQPRPAPKPAQPAAPAPAVVKAPAPKVVPAAPVAPAPAAEKEHAEPVAAHPETPAKAPAHAGPAAAASKRSWGVYGVIALVVVIVSVVIGKLYVDGRKQGEQLRVRQEADNARQAAIAKAEASLKVDPVTGLPGTWISSDIGGGTSPGSAVFKQAEFRLKGFGREIGGIKDSFLFTYIPLTGDGVITVRIITLGGANRVAKVGLMMRGTLDEGSNHVSLLIQNEGSDLKTVWREKAGEKTSVFDAAGDMTMSVPIWLRLVRAGKTVAAYHSENGRAWRLVSGTPLTVDMPGKIYAGLAVCSREDSATVATFDHVSVPGWESAPPILSGAE
ncbi:MAG: hypothetical protein WC661_07695 [Opitutaceae bacterium]|jgi:hypothetical protein